MYPHSAPAQRTPHGPHDPHDPHHLSCFHRFDLNGERSKIHNMSLSPDNKFLVHVLQGSDQHFCIYISRVEDMISWRQACVNAEEGFATTYRTSLTGSTLIGQSNASRSFSNGSMQSLDTVVLPWKHILLNRKPNVKISHIQALRFSADSQLFTLSSEPPNTNECIFYAWKTENGKYINSITLEQPVCCMPPWIPFKAILGSPSSLIVHREPSTQTKDGLQHLYQHCQHPPF